MSQLSSLGTSGSPASCRSARKTAIVQFLRTQFDDDVPSVLERAVEQMYSGKAADPSPPIKDPPPSAFAWRKVWKAFQFQQPPRFLAYRGPLSARPPMSLVLVHESFSDFACDLENEDLKLSAEDLDMAENVYTMFTEGFDDEVRDMNEGPLSKIFESYLDAGNIRQFGSLKMDGFMAFSRHQLHPIFIVFEDKPDDGPNGYMEGLEICRRLFLSNHHVSHGILVLRFCPYIIVIGLVMDRKSDVLLSEPLAHVAFWGPQYQTVLQGARALRALKNFSDNYVAQSDIDVSCPWPISSWQGVKPLSKDGLVFCGTSKNKCMVAKFTQLYSGDAHKAWHRKNLAPELYDIKALGAGWKFVTMQYLSADEGWHSVKDSLDDKLKQQLIDFLKKGHETNYVHGDFRPPNLLIHDGNGAIQAIDFEWSGREGEARYPVQLNPDIGWEPTAGRGKVLKKIHDFWLVGVDPAASPSQVASTSQVTSTSQVA